jgi:hypothetical protein
LDNASVLAILPKLVRAAFDGDKKTLESSCITIIRSIRKAHPDVAEELGRIISFNKIGASVTRSIGLSEPPTDKEAFMHLARIEEPDANTPLIVLHAHIDSQIEHFIKERQLADKLLGSGIQPSTSILVFGPPGVGKTYLSKYLSSRLRLPLVSLDIASLISSYLGNTGKNLKAVMDYAREKPCIFFLDEFDSIAKKRDDETDIGELKRLVNILLKEIEDWPSYSVLIAATNHPQLLDKAIWRRFDHAIEIPLPSERERLQLWRLGLDNELTEISAQFIDVMAEITEGMSGADIIQVSKRIARRVAIDNEDPISILVGELRRIYPEKNSKFNKRFSYIAKRTLGSAITQKQIARWLGISVSTVNYHLSNSDTLGD